MNITQLKDAISYDMDKLDSWEKGYLFEHFLASHDSNDNICHSGVVLDKSGNFLAHINGKDHLVMHSLDTPLNWERSWEKLSNIEATLSNNLSFAYSPIFGYLTSQPSNAGTALTVCALLHLPSLIHLNQIEDVLMTEINDEISVNAFQNNCGDIITIQNRYTLGVSEDHILREMHKSMTRLMYLEKTYRNYLLENPNVDLLDRVRRAIGLLKYSCQIKRKEALSALSLIKLGVDLQWIAGLNAKEINKLFFEMHHIYPLFPKHGRLTHDQIPHKRAELLQEALKSISMNL